MFYLCWQLGIISCEKESEEEFLAFLDVKTTIEFKTANSSSKPHVGENSANFIKYRREAVPKRLTVRWRVERKEVVYSGSDFGKF